MGPFLKITKNMKIDPNWTHIRRIGLRIKDFESQSRYQSNGTPPDPQNSHIKFKIGQKSNGPNRPNCPLNLAINRITSGEGHGSQEFDDSISEQMLRRAASG